MLDRPTVNDDPGASPYRLVHLYCRGCKHELTRARLPAGIGTPECPACGLKWMAILAEWVDQFPAISETGKRLQISMQRDQAGKTRGAYAGAVKIGAHGHALRARTGKSQGEFARLAGVSERSLRTWEGAADPAREAPKVHQAIVATLARLGVTYAPPQQRRPVRYRDPMTLMTWSGRGLQPAWLRVALAGGKRLADFEVAR